MRNIVSKTPSGKWNHLFICPNRELQQSLTQFLSEITPGASLVDLKAYPPRRQVSEIMRVQRPNLCFLDVGTDTEEAIALLNELCTGNPGLPVIAIHSSNNPDLILRCLRSGAREFLSQPFSSEQLVPALDRLGKMLLDTNVRDRQIGKVYCVMPGKGASGATTIACSLAYQFHRIHGKESKTLLADFDPSTGMLAFNLKLRPTFSFLEALTHINSLDESIWKGLVTTLNGLDLVLAPDTPQNGAVQHANPAPIIDYARDFYKTIVVDAQSPYGHWGLGLARSCDELLMVTTNELPTLHATQRALAHLEHNAVDRSKIRLIVNRYNPEAGLGREAIETALKLDVFEMLPDDTDAVTKALLDGKPMQGNTSIGKGIAHMAQKLAGTSGAAKSKSLFGNLFNLFGE